jgi:hypothetical protein
MTFSYSLHREKRLQDILFMLPSFEGNAHGKTMRELFKLLSDNYDAKTEESGVRSLQYDLRYLQESGDIISESIPGQGTALHYRKAKIVNQPADNINLSELYQELITRGVSSDLASDLINRVQLPTSYYQLPQSQFISVPDTIRLTPKVNPDPNQIIQQEIISALKSQKTLKISYKKQDTDAEQNRVLHPIGVILRGLQHYLVAFDDADLSNKKHIQKMFKINRIMDANILDTNTSLPAHKPLIELIEKEGLADFVYEPQKQQIKLYAYGYLMTLLKENNISEDQLYEEFTDEDNERYAIVTASIIISGTLLRWLLSFGCNVEVLEPESLRRIVAEQASYMTGYYEDENTE